MDEPIIVVGGGAAGMMAAGRAASLGAPVLLLEKTPKLGNKLRITGKGRCNVTNVAPWNEFVARFGANGRFLYGAFSQFFVDDLRAFLAERGVPTAVERGGRVFPAANDADVVAEALVSYLRQGRVTVRRRTPVSEILTEDGRVAGVRSGEREYRGRCVIVATGGCSYPGTGSTGDGYRLLAQLGHTIITPRPALVPLVVAEPFVGRLQGLSLRNVQLTLLAEGRARQSLLGEMLFTSDGVSGPIVLTLSKAAAEAAATGRAELSIDLKPALSDEELDARLRRDLDTFGRRSYRHILAGLLPRLLVDVFVDLTGVPADKPGHQVTAMERARLRALLRDLRLTVTGTRPIGEAIITAGGVATDELEPRTLQSRRVHGLYCCGEVLDVDADTGGYNLQAAFSTGHVAGEAAARALGYRA
ncbi:MAG: NAD(P)/FAD-dependent oxidoreductase [Anaerolineae bacterium]